MSPQTSADPHSLAAPYALDALDTDARERFEQHLRRCEPCRAELAGFVATAAHLAAEPRTPPADLRARLLHDIRTTPQDRPPHTELDRHRRMRHALPRLAVAAALLLGMVGAGGFAAEREHAHTYQSSTSEISTVLSAPDASTKARAFAVGGNVRLVASSTNDAAVMVVNDLPRLDADHVYEVWMMGADAARSQGTLATGGTMIMHGLSRAASVAVTVEPRGGSTRPTTTPLVTLAL